MKIKESQPTQSLLLAVVAIALFGCASLPLEHGDFVQGKQGAVSGRSAHNRSDVRRAKRTQTDMEPYCAICGKPGHAGNWSHYNVNLIECIDKVDDARERIERNIR